VPFLHPFGHVIRLERGFAHEAGFVLHRACLSASLALRGLSRAELELLLGDVLGEGRVVVGRVREVEGGVFTEDHPRGGVVHFRRELRGGKGAEHLLLVSEARDEDGRAPRVLALLLDAAVGPRLLTRGLLRLLLGLGGVVVG